MKHIIKINERQLKTMINSIISFSIGIILTLLVISPVPETFYLTEKRPVNKISPFENYTNNEIRNAINFSSRYICQPRLLEVEHPIVWMYWQQYNNKVVNASYNYWILCYSFNL